MFVIENFKSNNLIVIFAVAANAQVEKSEIVTLTARLINTMALTLVCSPIIFEFNTLDEPKNGLGGIEGDSRSAARDPANQTGNFLQRL